MDIENKVCTVHHQFLLAVARDEEPVQKKIM